MNPNYIKENYFFQWSGNFFKKSGKSQGILFFETGGNPAPLQRVSPPENRLCPSPPLQAIFSKFTNPPTVRGGACYGWGINYNTVLL